MSTISVKAWDNLVNGWDHEAEREARSKDVFNLIKTATETDDWVLIAQLLKRGASPNMVDAGVSPLMLCVEKGAFKCARLLLDTGAAPSWAGADGICALMRSIMLSNDDLVDLLLSKGANPTRRDKQKRTPLIHAAIVGSFHSAKAMVDLFVDIDARDASGQTALHHVLKKREPTGDDIAIARMLLDGGGSPEKRDLSGKRPIDVVGHDSFLAALEAAQLEAAVAPYVEEPKPEAEHSEEADGQTQDQEFGVRHRRKRPRL